MDNTSPLSWAEPLRTKAQTIGGKSVSTPPITLNPKLPPTLRSISTIFELDIAKTSLTNHTIL